MDKVIFLFSCLFRSRYSNYSCCNIHWIMGMVCRFIMVINLFLFGCGCNEFTFLCYGTLYEKNGFIDDKFNFYRCLSAFIIWFICFYLFFRPQNIALNMITQNAITFYLAAISGSICSSGVL